MANQTTMFLPEGKSFTRPPFFNGTNYNYWKNCMIVFIKAQENDLWKIIRRGPHEVNEDEDERTDEEVKKARLNYCAMHLIQCALDPNEYSRVSMCDNAKEMWDKLSLIYEGTSQVKESKVNMLVHEYELFTMRQEESISEMFARLSEITNGLKGLGKVCTEHDLVRKILRSLPTVWNPKVTAIEEAKDLSKLSIDELIGSLMTYELNQKRGEEEKRKKSLALRASPEESDSSEDETPEDSNEELAMISKQVKRLMSRRKKILSYRRPRKFIPKGDKEEIICYECKKPGHMKGECPELKKKKLKKPFQKKKAMVATWSDEEEEEDSNHEQEDDIANICFMANDNTKVNTRTHLSFDQLPESYAKILEENRKLK